MFRETECPPYRYISKNGMPYVQQGQCIFQKQNVFRIVTFRKIEWPPYNSTRAFHFSKYTTITLHIIKDVMVVFREAFSIHPQVVTHRSISVGHPRI